MTKALKVHYDGDSGEPYCGLTEVVHLSKVPANVTCGRCIAMATNLDIASRQMIQRWAEVLNDRPVVTDLTKRVRRIRVGQRVAVRGYKNESVKRTAKAMKDRQFEFSRSSIGADVLVRIS